MPEVSAPKPRLLFVEDEATLREHLAERLSDEYIVDTAGNGNDALLAVMRAKPVLVVTDIVMPDMDGVELLKTLRQSPGTRAIPVLLISGRAPKLSASRGSRRARMAFSPSRTRSASCEPSWLNGALRAVAYGSCQFFATSVRASISKEISNTHSRAACP